MEDIGVRQILMNLSIKEDANKTIRILARYCPNIDFSDKKKLLESLMYYHRISETEIDVNIDAVVEDGNAMKDLERHIGKDYRIKYLEVDNVRGIPERDSEGVAFGVDFLDGGTINSAIILANNGTGKSSIFSALEMLYTQEISERKLRKGERNVSKGEYVKYLQRFPSLHKPYLSIRTVEGIFDFENIPFRADSERQILRPANHFISDFDIYNYGQTDFDGAITSENSFHSLIAESLGLGGIIRLQSILRETLVYKRLSESNSLRKLERQYADALDNIEKNEVHVSIKRGELEGLRGKGDNDTLDYDLRKSGIFVDLLGKPITITIEAGVYRRTIDEFLNAYLEWQSIGHHQPVVKEGDFLAMGLDIMHEYDGCPFCQRSSISKDEIKNVVEERLRLLEETERLDKRLKELYGTVTEMLFSFYKEMRFIYDEIIKERIEVIKYNELRFVSGMEERLYLQLSTVLHDDELVEHIGVLRQKSYPGQSDYDALAGLVRQDVIFSNHKIISEVEWFIFQRITVLNSILKGGSQRGTIRQQIVVLHEDIKRLDDQIASTRMQLQKLEQQIKEAKGEVELVARIKSDIEAFLPFLDVEINKMVNEYFDPIQNVVEAVLKEYLNEDAIILNIAKEDNVVVVDGEEIVNSIIVARIKCIDKDTGQVKVTTPDIYFNTFRFKLFCLMVNVSLALATRKKYKLNIPLVFDDVFFSSDFISKNSFSRFLQTVIKLFYKYVPHLPLQFIIFTHDDLIFRSAIDAIDTFEYGEVYTDLNEGEKLKLADRTIIGRLFPPQDKESTFSHFEDGTKYWSLLYRLPKTSDYLLNN